MFRWGTKSDMFMEVHSGDDVCITGRALISESLGRRMMRVLQSSKQGISSRGAGRCVRHWSPSYMRLSIVSSGRKGNEI